MNADKEALAENMLEPTTIVVTFDNTYEPFEECSDELKLFSAMMTTADSKWQIYD